MPDSAHPPRPRDKADSKQEPALPERVTVRRSKYRQREGYLASGKDAAGRGFVVWAPVREQAEAVASALCDPTRAPRERELRAGELMSPALELMRETVHCDPEAWDLVTSGPERKEP